MFSTPKTSKSLTMAASEALDFGRIKPLKPCFLASIAIGNAPLIGCNPPSSESSPIIR